MHESKEAWDSTSFRLIQFKKVGCESTADPLFLYISTVFVGATSVMTSQLTKSEH